MKFFILLTGITLCITLTNFACEDELTGDEDRGALLRIASMNFKTPCWPQTCASRYPSCHFSRERRTYNSVMARLTDQIGPRYSPKNLVKEKCLACYTDTCSHPFCALGTVAAVTAFTILDAFGWIGNPDFAKRLLPECAAVIIPFCGCAADCCCRDYLTDPKHWENGIDTDMEPPFTPVTDEVYDVIDSNASRNIPDGFEDLS